jgi:hypothetical protein
MRMAASEEESPEDRGRAPHHVFSAPSATQVAGQSGCSTHLHWLLVASVVMGEASRLAVGGDDLPD